MSTDSNRIYRAIILTNSFDHRPSSILTKAFGKVQANKGKGHGEANPSSSGNYNSLSGRRSPKISKNQLKFDEKHTFKKSETQKTLLI